METVDIKFCGISRIWGHVSIWFFRFFNCLFIFALISSKFQLLPVLNFQAKMTIKNITFSFRTIQYEMIDIVYFYKFPW